MKSSLVVGEADVMPNHHRHAYRKARGGLPAKCRRQKVPAPVRRAGGDHEDLGAITPRHRPHRFDIVSGEASISGRIEMSEPKAIL
jgi:hypothetical protein